MKDDIVRFFELIRNNNGEISDRCKALIFEKSQKDHFKNFFDFKFQEKTKDFQQNFEYSFGITLLEYILYKYLEKIHPQEKFNAYYLLINFKWYNNESQKALDLIKKVEADFKKSLNYHKILSRKGSVYKTLGRYKEALECFYKALKIVNNQKGENDNAVFYIKNNIGTVYYRQKELEQAIYVYEKNLITQIALNNKLEISICYMNLANVYNVQDKNKKSISYNLKALKLSKEIGDFKEIERININLVNSYIKIDNLALAQKHTDIGKKSLQTQVKQLAIRSDLRIALLQFEKLENPTEEEKDYLYNKAKKSFKSTESSDDKNHKEDNFEIIAKALEYVGKENEAISVLRKKFNIYKELIEYQRIEEYRELRESHEIQLQQKEIERKEELLLQKEKLNVKLQQVNDELEQFTAMASHDLKSPLRNISAFCSLIEDEESSKEEIKEYTSLIKADTSKMSNLISSLLNYSKVGFNEIEFEMLDLESIVKNVVERLKTDIEAKNASVEFYNLPKIKGNALLLNQLFENLISNALKYNDKVKPLVIIKATNKENEIEVSDNGIGIPDHKINEVFKAFIRAHASTKYEGSGVGLATCKKIMDIHNGNISVRSEIAKGSCFTLSF